MLKTSSYLHHLTPSQTHCVANDIYFSHLHVPLATDWRDLLLAGCAPSGAAAAEVGAHEAADGAVASLSWLMLRLPTAGAKAVVVEEAGAEGASLTAALVAAGLGMWLVVEVVG